MEVTENQLPRSVSKKPAKPPTVTAPVAITKHHSSSATVPAVMPKQTTHGGANDAIFDNDHRAVLANYNPTKNISVPVMTEYEIPLVLGKRATQIAHGAIPLIQVRPGMGHLEIATEELRQKMTPYIIKRKIGTHVEYWKIADMIINI